MRDLRRVCGGPGCADEWATSAGEGFKRFLFRSIRIGIGIRIIQATVELDWGLRGRGHGSRVGNWKVGVQVEARCLGVLEGSRGWRSRLRGDILRRRDARLTKWRRHTDSLYINRTPRPQRAHTHTHTHSMNILMYNITRYIETNATTSACQHCWCKLARTTTPRTQTHIHTRSMQARRSSR